MVNLGWNREHQGQTIHPTETFISMNLLQMSCVMTWAQKIQPPTSEKRMRPFFSFILFFSKWDFGLLNEKGELRRIVIIFLKYLSTNF